MYVNNINSLTELSVIINLHKCLQNQVKSIAAIDSELPYAAFILNTLKPNHTLDGRELVRLSFLGH